QGQVGIRAAVGAVGLRGGEVIAQEERGALPAGGERELITPDEGSDEQDGMFEGDERTGEGRAIELETLTQLLAPQEAGEMARGGGSAFRWQYVELLAVARQDRGLGGEVSTAKEEGDLVGGVAAQTHEPPRPCAAVVVGEFGDPVDRKPRPLDDGLPTGFVTQHPKGERVTA